MSEKIAMMKRGHMIIPRDQTSSDMLEEMQDGEYFIELSRPRNADYHRKFFTLLRYLFERFNPPNVDNKLTRKYGQPVKNFDSFRKDLHIQAGHYTPTVNTKGEYRLVANSISFANMSGEEFDKLYSDTIDLALSSVYFYANSREEVEQAIEHILNYA